MAGPTGRFQNFFRPSDLVDVPNPKSWEKVGHWFGGIALRGGLTGGIWCPHFGLPTFAQKTRKDGPPARFVGHGWPLRNCPALTGPNGCRACRIPSRSPSTAAKPARSRVGGTTRPDHWRKSWAKQKKQKAVFARRFSCPTTC